MRESRGRAAQKASELHVLRFIVNKQLWPFFDIFYQSATTNTVFLVRTPKVQKSRNLHGDDSDAPLGGLSLYLRLTCDTLYLSSHYFCYRTVTCHGIVQKYTR